MRVKPEKMSTQIKLNELNTLLDTIKSMSASQFQDQFRGLPIEMSDFTITAGQAKTKNSTISYLTAWIHGLEIDIARDKADPIAEVPVAGKTGPELLAMFGIHDWSNRK